MANIQVAIRVRPLIQRELDSGSEAQWVVKNNTIACTEQGKQSDFIFDHVFDSNTVNLDLFEAIGRPIVDDAVNGFNGTIFAYGQSGSGKTHTMTGTALQPGVISLAVEEIFQKIENIPDREFLIRVGYLEIYKEKVSDLLKDEDTILKIQEDSDHNVQVVGLEEEIVKDFGEVLKVIKKGDVRRRTSETKENARSSRSHAIIRFVVESRAIGHEDDAVKVSNLYFVDLAGSEKAAENTGERRREGVLINKSLFTLGMVIRKLSGDSSQQHVSLRDSNLTRILSNALGGNSMTAIVCTITPARVDESISTLNFASRAKNIKNKPIVNEVMSEAAMLRRYQQQVHELQRQIDEMSDKKVEVDRNEIEKQRETIEKLKAMIVTSGSSHVREPQAKRKRRETWCGQKLKRPRASMMPDIPEVPNELPLLSDVPMPKVLSKQGSSEPLNESIGIFEFEATSPQNDTMAVNNTVKELFELQDKHEVLMEEFKKKEGELQELQEFTEFERQMEAESIVELKNKVKSLEGQVKSLEGSSPWLEDELLKVQQERNGLRQKVEAMGLQLEAANDGTGISNAEKKLGDSETKTAELTSDLEVQKSRYEFHIEQMKKQMESYVVLMEQSGIDQEQIKRISIQDEVSKEQTDLNGKHEQELTALRDEIDMLIISLEKEKNSVKDMKAVFEAEFEQQKKVFNTDLKESSEAIKIYEEEYMSMKSRYEQELAGLNDEMAKLRNNGASNVENRHGMIEMRNEEANIVKNHSKDGKICDGANKNVRFDVDSEIAGLKDKYESKMDELIVERDAEKSRNQELVKALETDDGLEEKYLNKIHEYESRIKELTEEREAEKLKNQEMVDKVCVEELKYQYENRIRELIDERDAVALKNQESKDQNFDADSKIAGLKEQYENEMQDLIDAEQSKNQESLDYHKNEELKDQYEKRIQELTEERDSELLKNKELMDLKLDFDSMVEGLKDTYENRITDLLQEREAEKSQELTDNLEKGLKDQNESIKELTQEKYAEKSSNLERVENLEIEGLKKKYENIVKQLTEERDAQISKNEELLDNHADEIEKIKDEFRKFVEENFLEEKDEAQKAAEPMMVADDGSAEKVTDVSNEQQVKNEFTNNLEIEELKDQYEKKIKELTEERDAEKSSNQEKMENLEIEGLKNKYENIIKQLTEEKDAQMSKNEELLDNHADEIEKIKDECRMFVEENFLKEKAAEPIIVADDASAEKVAGSSNEEQVKYGLTDNLEIEELKDQYERRIKELTEQRDAEKSSNQERMENLEIEGLKNKYENRIKQLTEERDAQISKNEELLDNHADEIEKIKDEFRKFVEENFLKEKDEAQKVVEPMMVADDASAEKVAGVSNEQQVKYGLTDNLEIEELKDQYERRIKELTEERDAEKSSSQEKMENLEIEGLKNKYENIIKQLTEERDAQISKNEELLDNHADEIVKIKDECRMFVQENFLKDKEVKDERQEEVEPMMALDDTSAENLVVEGISNEQQVKMLEECQIECSTLREGMQKLYCNIDVLESRNRNLNQQKVDLLNSRSQAETEIKELQEKLQDLQQVAATYNEKLKGEGVLNVEGVETFLEENKFEDKWNEVKRQIAILQEECDVLKEDKIKLENTIRSLKMKNEAFKYDSNFEDTGCETHNAMETNVDEMQIKIEKLQEEITPFEREKCKLVDTKEENMEMYKCQLSSSEVLTNDLEIDTEKELNKKLQTTIEALHQELDSLRNIKQELEDSETAHEMESKRLQEKVVDLELLLVNSQDVTANESEQMQATISTLQEQASSLLTEKEDLKNAMEEANKGLQTNLEALHQELDSLRNRKQELEDSETAHEMEIKKLQEKVVDLELLMINSQDVTANESKQMQATISTLQEQVNSLLTEKEDLEKETNKEFQTNLEALHQEVDSLRNRKQELEDSETAHEMEIKKLQEKVVDLELLMINSQDVTANESKQMQATISTLQEQVNSLLTEKEDFINLEIEKNMEIEKMQDRITMLETLINSVENSAEKQELNDVHTMTDLDIGEITGQLEMLQNEIVSLKTEKCELLDGASKKDIEIMNLRELIRSKISTNNAAQSQIEELTLSLKVLKKKTDEIMEQNREEKQTSEKTVQGLIEEKESLREDVMQLERGLPPHLLKYRSLPENVEWEAKWEAFTKEEKKKRLHCYRKIKNLEKNLEEEKEKSNDAMENARMELQETIVREEEYQKLRDVMVMADDDANRLNAELLEEKEVTEKLKKNIHKLQEKVEELEAKIRDEPAEKQSNFIDQDHRCKYKMESYSTGRRLEETKEALAKSKQELEETIKYYTEKTAQLKNEMRRRYSSMDVTFDLRSGKPLSLGFMENQVHGNGQVQDQAIQVGDGHVYQGSSTAGGFVDQYKVLLLESQNAELKRDLEKMKRQVSRSSFQQPNTSSCKESSTSEKLKRKRVTEEIPTGSICHNPLKDVVVKSDIAGKAPEAAPETVSSAGNKKDSKLHLNDLHSQTLCKTDSSIVAYEKKDTIAPEPTEAPKKKKVRNYSMLSETFWKDDSILESEKTDTSVLTSMKKDNSLSTSMKKTNPLLISGKKDNSLFTSGKNESAVSKISSQKSLRQTDIGVSSPGSTGLKDSSNTLLGCGRSRSDDMGTRDSSSSRASLRTGSLLGQRKPGDVDECKMS